MSDGKDFLILSLKKVKMEEEAGGGSLRNEDSVAKRLVGCTFF